MYNINIYGILRKAPTINIDGKKTNSVLKMTFVFTIFIFHIRFYFGFTNH